MLTLIQAVLLGALQGVTELFPISSLGHTVILPAVFGWDIDQANPYFVSFLVLTHLATALVLFFFFLPDWLRIIGGFFRSLRTRTLAGDTHARLAWVIVIATIPPGLLGLLFQKKFEAFFAAPAYAALFLAANGLVLLLAEWLTRRRPKEGEESDDRIARLPFLSAVLVGFAESLALFPGFSRTGTTLSGGLLAGMNRSDAARYSFLLATPLIFAAALLKVPHLVLAGGTPLVIALSGAASAGLFAYLSVRFLTKYFKTNSLLPFAIYCIAAGITAFAIIG